MTLVYKATRSDGHPLPSREVEIEDRQDIDGWSYFITTEKKAMLAIPTEWVVSCTK